MIRDISIGPGEIPEAAGNNQLVYHYTTISGLLGIIEKKEIWATDVWYMNDAVEATYALETTRSYLDSKRQDPGDGQLIAKAAFQQMRQIPSKPANNARSYIACFSRNPDQLSQWRAYGSSRGFSIGFHIGALRAIAGDLHANANANLREVIYKEETQVAMLEDKFNATLSTFATPTSETDALPAAMSFIAEAGLLAPTFKHVAFEEEAEVRLHLYQYTADTAAPLKFRESADGLIPYVKLPLTSANVLASNVIKGIVIGPQANREETARAVRQLLDRRDLEGAEVRMSEVPLRR